MERKVKKKPIIIMVISIIIVLIIGISIALYIKDQNYKKTYDYKLGKLGYSKEEIITIKKLDEDSINIILSHEYDAFIIDLIQRKYFLKKNLDKYLDYIKENDSNDFDKVIAIINVGANKEWYTDTTLTDTSKNELLLTNKFYKLNEDYEPDDLIDISNVYAYGENQKLRKDAYDAFINMFNGAKKEDITLIVNSSYRSYQDQEETYNNYSSWYGSDEADKIAARPGFSEHQTGLSLDIQSYKTNRNNFEESDAFKWLQDNAYKYGFILRYPKDLEYLTGYNYESWHYRYVGIEAATYIHENNITYDEYYAYFIEK